MPDLRLEIGSNYTLFKSDFDLLLARADRALYQSKETGRNRVSAWRENES